MTFPAPIPTDTANLDRLIKAVWAAGFRIGKISGDDDATSYLHGCQPETPQDPNAAWKAHVEPRLQPLVLSDYRLNPYDPESWSKIA